MTMDEKQTSEAHDGAFGASAAEDQERADRGEEPKRSPDDAPRAGGKAPPEDD
jgi:hypothetical protein